MSTSAFQDIAVIVPGQTSPEDAISAADYPASGSYIDVSGYERFTIMVHLGAIAGSDAPVFTPKVADAANGTADVIDATLAHTSADDDDDEFIVWDIQTQKLPLDHHFVTLTASGTLVGTQGDIVFFLREPRSTPVTQGATLPTASQYEFAG